MTGKVSSVVYLAIFQREASVKRAVEAELSNVILDAVIAIDIPVQGAVNSRVGLAVIRETGTTIRALEGRPTLSAL